MRKAVFLDRDGVINVDNGYVYKPEDFCFIDGVFDFCRYAQDKGYIIIIITNQAGIARGYYTEDMFEKLTDWMLEQFEVQGINIEKVYYCPYHQNYGIGRYKQDSPDRKPNPGMILRARDEYDIDLPRSILIGDKSSDIEAGDKAGIGTLVFLRGKYDCKTDILHKVCTDFTEIIDLLE